jgi:putative nucleotidyltransferase with HDIG domain
VTPLAPLPSHCLTPCCREADEDDVTETATSDLSRVFARLLAGRALELPPLPAVAAEVASLCQQDGTDAAKVSAMIHRDQAIASHVLRVANSAAYATQVPCASLQQAVGRLGLQLVTEIAMAVAVRGRMFANAAHADLLAALWRHSVMTGFFAKEVARVRRRNVETAFLCGLLHDVGKALLLGGADAALGRDEPAPPAAQLLHAVDEQHLAAGELLAAEWRLPASIAAAIRWHHEPAAAGPFAELALTVQLADVLAHHCAPSALAAQPTESELRLHAALVPLNLYRDQLDALLRLKERALLVTEGMR